MPGAEELGVDLVERVDRGGLLPTAKIPVGPGFQTEFAARIAAKPALPPPPSA